MVVESAEILSEDQEDVFRELINIAYGKAAGLLYALTQVEIKLHVPEVSFCPGGRFVKDIRKALFEKMVVSKQSFHGEIAGETLMVFSRRDATSLAHLLNRSGELEDEDVLSSIYEVSNIITTLSTQIFSELSKVPVIFEQPTTEFHSPESFLHILGGSDYSQVVSISTYLDIPEQNITGKIYYLFYRQSMALLAKSLDYAG